MEANNDDPLDQFAQRAVAAAGTEEPSLDFTATVMKHITQLEDSKVIVYEPLISKKVWVVIAIAVVAVLGYAFIGNSELTFFNELRQDFAVGRDSWQMPALTFDVAPSSILVYSFFILAVLVMVEIPLLKRMLKS